MGGLKKVEGQVGLSREELDGVDGFFAVLLWHDYWEEKNSKALETLLAYNVEDVINLEWLMVFAYNENLKQTPFYPYNKIKTPAPVDKPFEPHMGTLRRIKQKFYSGYYV